jgi:hypothetical protein
MYKWAVQEEPDYDKIYDTEKRELAKDDASC